MKATTKRMTGNIRKAGRAERKEDLFDESLDPVDAIRVPDDQVSLTPVQLEEDITRVITASNPQAATNLVVFNFSEKGYKSVPSGADEHVTFHLSIDGSTMLASGEDAVEQLTYERQFRSMVDNRRRERMMAYHERLASGTAQVNILPDDLDDEVFQRNQFNFTERAAQTYNNISKNRVVSTIPPESESHNGRMTQWQLFDAYSVEFERYKVQLEIERSGQVKSSKSGSTTSAVTKKKPRSDDPIHSAEMSAALKILERLTINNFQHNLYIDFLQGEYTTSQQQPDLGVCMPLWDFYSEEVRDRSVTSIVWNTGYSDLMAVCFGSYDFLGQRQGLIQVYSLKNSKTPEFTFTLDTSVVSADFHPTFHPLLAVGCYDGTVRVYDIRRKENKPLFISSTIHGKHTDVVWQVKWLHPNDLAGAAGTTGAVAGAAGINLTDGSTQFLSVSADGVVARWLLYRNELRMEPAVSLRSSVLPLSTSGANSTLNGIGESKSDLPASGARGASATPFDSQSLSQNLSQTQTQLGSTSSGNAASIVSSVGGTSFDVSSFSPSLILVGAEDGSIAQFNLQTNGQRLSSFIGHTLPVHTVRFNPFHPRVFISCSADWTVRIWDTSHPYPVLSFDLRCAVNDVAWAPFSSTVFACVGEDNFINVWDLSVNKHKPLCSQLLFPRSSKSSRGVTKVLFSAYHPTVVVGNADGQVRSYKLSSNLRKITPLPIPQVKKGAPPPPMPSRAEVEIRKFDQILALSDAKIDIVTPIPGEKVKSNEEAQDSKAEE